MPNDENKIILEFPATNVEIELGETITFDNISGFLDSGRVTYNGESLTEKITHLENDKADTTYVNTELAKKADKTDTYTRSQVDNKLANKADVSDLPDMSQYYDKRAVDNALSYKADQSDFETLENAVSGLSDDVEALDQNKADKSDTYTKEQVDDIVYGILPDDTASGSVANFETDLALPIKSLEVDVNAVQESGTPTPETPLPISGRSAISLVSCGKNLFDEDTWFLANGYTKNEDGSYYRSTTPLNAVMWENKTGYSGQISLSFLYKYDNSNAQGFRPVIRYTDGTTSPIYTSQTTSFVLKTATSTSGKTVRDIVTSYGSNIGSTLKDFQIELGSSASTFESFNGNTAVINLGGTYYGGVLHIDKNGHRTFEATHEYETDMGQYNYTYVSASNCFRATNFNKAYKRTAYSIIANSLCSHYGGAKLQEVLNQSANNSTYAFGIVGFYNGSVLFRNTNYSDATAFKSSMQGVSMTFELETPIIIDLPDGEPIITINGTNNIYADTGDTSVVFKCSVNDYVSAHSGGGNLLGMGGVYLGGAKSSGGEEDPTEDTEKVKLDETKVEVKEIGDDSNIKKLGGE